MESREFDTEAVFNRLTLCALQASFLSKELITSQNS